MSQLIQAISQVQDYEIEEVMIALLKRHGELFPDWEMHLISIEKAGDRGKQIDEVIRFLERLKIPPENGNPG